MLVDANIGGRVDGTSGGDFETLRTQLDDIADLGFDGVWTTEVGRDPFLPLLLAAEHLPEVTIGTAIAVAFARNPMTMAAAAYDLQAFSGGRFVLGVGSQVKAHIERRFSMSWSEPAARMEEFIAAMRAIWSAWAGGPKLDFEGRFYQHTLMTPMFVPDPHPWGPPPVLLAAVGPSMTKVAGRAADGLIVHSFTTERCLREQTVPLVESELSAGGRTRADFTISLPGLVATGQTEDEILAARDEVRRQLSFYGATPAYRGVLELHGWGDLHTELHRLSKEGRWQVMAGLVDDEVLETFAVCGTPEQAGALAAERFSSLLDRFTFYAPYPVSGPTRRRFVEAARAAQD